MEENRMGSKRRREYLPIGTYPIYDRTFDNLRLDSPILNPEKVLNWNSIIWDKQNLKYELLAREGNVSGENKGKFYRLGKWMMAELPACHEKISKIESDFKDYCQKRVNEGNIRPKSMPKEMHEELLILHAKEDVILEEMEELKKRLNNFHLKEETERIGMMLKWGCQGARKLRDGVCASIDGQKVSVMGKGVLVIDDPVSPYHMVIVSDYLEKICFPWQRATAKLKEAKIALEKKLKAQHEYDEEAFIKQWKKEIRPGIEEANGWKPMFEVFFNGHSIPSAKDIKRYEPKVKGSSESSGTMKRTK